MAFLLDPNLPQRYTGFAREEPLAPLAFNSYNQDNPHLKRLRSQQYNTNLGEAIGFSIGGTAISAFDSIIETLGIVDKDTTEEYLADVYPEFANFFLRHRDNFQIAGDITGALLLGGVAAGAVRTTGFLGRTMSRIFGDKATPFLSTGQTAQSLSQQAVRRATYVGSRPQARNLDIDAAFRQAKGYVAKRRLADFAIEAVAAETAIVAGMHGSEFLFPEEMSVIENVVWALGTNAIIGAGFFAHGWRTVRKMSQDVAGPLKAAATNPDELPLTDLPANMYSGQGSAMAVLGQQLEVITRQKTSADQAADPQTLANIATAQTSIREIITDISQRAAHGRPIEAINDAFDLSPDQTRALTAAVEKNPEIFAAMQSLENYDSAKGFVLAYQQNKLNNWVRNLESESSSKWVTLQGIKQKLADKGELSEATRKHAKRLQDQIHELQQQLEAAKRLTPFTIELNGSIRIGANRPPMYQDGERPITQPLREEGESGTFGQRSVKGKYLWKPMWPVV